MIRARLVRLAGGFIQSMHYIGPLSRVPAGWAVVTRRTTGTIR
jgi:hypothetical protein